MAGQIAEGTRPVAKDLTEVEAGSCKGPQAESPHEDLGLGARIWAQIDQPSTPPPREGRVVGLWSRAEARHEQDRGVSRPSCVLGSGGFLGRCFDSLGCFCLS